MDRFGLYGESGRFGDRETQKGKGMSWTEQGSGTLAQLKIAELNGQWEQLFAPSTEADGLP